MFNNGMMFTETLTKRTRTISQKLLRSDRHNKFVHTQEKRYNKLTGSNID
jgi:hypothetical protein